MTKATLYYVYDPMCSWCWGFKSTWDTIQSTLKQDVAIQYVLGGLAPDTDIAMPETMQRQIASYWQRIEQELGAVFNYEFWSKNTPRRATYPACRAILAARKQNAEQAMNQAIQQGYYLQAKNPSDDDVLIALAQDIGLDVVQFEADFKAQSTQQTLLEEIQFARSIGGNSFPSLFVYQDSNVTELPIDYKNPSTTIDLVRSLITTTP
ncbi:DsbA family protein [Vibrio methylphosphonaticus]|uniref:DsbA family protein n=1 Tax=Vibrio methylphosphonaticus TaxID=2946866 RepID=UPI00202A50AA|nr:DsbA family protein [Vibrio methylphosphonaticus]MCL9774473.1 DsbA family protein [Vibrio methylphosphonaticus]